MLRIAIIGLGRFGLALVQELSTSRVEVIAIDSRVDLVDAIKDQVSLAVTLDSTDQQALMSQEVQDVDICVVAIGENFEAALLTTVLAKKLGVPHVICRAQTEYHAEIFRQIGADEVIQPEMQAGAQLARRLANPHLEELIPLAEGYSLIELHAPGRFQGKTLKELALRSRFGVNLIGIRRPRFVEKEGQMVREETVLSVPQPDDAIQSNDVLVLVGSDQDLAKLPKE